MYADLAGSEVILHLRGHRDAVAVLLPVHIFRRLVHVGPTSDRGAEKRFRLLLQSRQIMEVVGLRQTSTRHYIFRGFWKRFAQNSC